MESAHIDSLGFLKMQSKYCILKIFKELAANFRTTYFFLVSFLHVKSNSTCSLNLQASLSNLVIFQDFHHS